MTTPTTGPGGRLSKALAGERPVSAYEQFRRQINMVRRDIAALIGEEKVDKFIRVCLNAAQHNPDVLAANRRTLLLACMEAAQDGLIPDGTEAVFNVYSTKVPNSDPAQYVNVVQYLPMAYGLVQKIYESGATGVDAVAVYAKDQFEYERGDQPRIKHVPFQGNEQPGDVVAAYCVVKYPNLETKREVMFRRDIEKVKEKSKAKNGLMWKDFYDQAAIKSVIHRINKQLPQSERLSRVLAADNRAAGLVDITSQPEENTGTDLAALVDGRLQTELNDEPMSGRTAAPLDPEGTRTIEGIATHSLSTTGATGTTTTASPAPGDQKPIPKQGDTGTPEQKTGFLAKMQTATLIDVLDIVMEDVRFFKWSDEDLKEMTAKYVERKGALEA